MLAKLAPLVAVVIVGASTLVLSGCSPQVTGPVLVLQLATPDKSSDETAGPIKYFADEVDRRSGGAIRIEPVWDVAPGPVRNWDQITAKAVMDGTYELGLVPSRGFDVLGVDTLRALNTPFLITSQAALKTVLESKLRDELLEGLPDAGLVGLDIFPDGLRHPFGYNQPLDGAEDYDGVLIRASTSNTVSRLFESLGAHVTDRDPHPPASGGAESQFSLAPAGLAYATGNVTFFLKANVLVAQRDVRTHMRPDQWDILRDAAGATRDWQFSEQQSDFEAAAGFCDRGGEIVTASADQVESLQPAAAAVRTWLRRDTTTSQLIDAIANATRDVHTATPVTKCPGNPKPDARAAPPSVDGHYRARVTREDLVRAGVTDEDAIVENTGRFTWTLHSHTWSYHTEANHYLASPDDTGRFTYEDGVLTIHWDDSGDQSRVTVHVSRSGTIRFSDVHEGLPENQSLGEGFFAGPWIRIGHIPR
jgi:TRAP-type C4-dicarboxylate transport system substrate-binding protein